MFKDCDLWVLAQHQVDLHRARSLGVTVNRSHPLDGTPLDDQSAKKLSRFVALLENQMVGGH